MVKQINIREENPALQLTISQSSGKCCLQAVFRIRKPVSQEHYLQMEEKEDSWTGGKQY